jgi:hypothetical protein
MTVTMLEAPCFENPFEKKTAFFHQKLMKEGKARESVNIANNARFPS